MNKLFTLLIALVFSFGAYAQSSSASDAVIVAKARIEVQASCLAGTGNVSSSVTRNVDGTYTVYFFNTFNCPPNQICPLYLRIAPLARVTVDGDLNVTDYTCGFPVYQLQ